MSGHTPGPWYVLGDDEYATGCPFIEIASGECPSSEFRAIAWAIAEEDSISEEERSNARLIAAAPDLLAACKAAEARIVKLYSGIGPHADRPDGSNGHAEQDEVVHMLRTAISKAELP